MAKKPHAAPAIDETPVPTPPKPQLSPTDEPTDFASLLASEQPSGDGTVLLRGDEDDVAWGASGAPVTPPPPSLPFSYQHARGVLTLGYGEVPGTMRLQLDLGGTVSHLDLDRDTASSIADAVLDFLTELAIATEAKSFAQPTMGDGVVE